MFGKFKKQKPKSAFLHVFLLFSIFCLLSNVGSLQVFARTKVKKAQAATEVPTIYPRSSWSNEKYDQRSKKLWPAQIEKPEIIIVHHTATSYKGSTSKQIKKIYKYHSYTRRWGDIGYNYIIGQDGSIFEGRYGGNGVVGGHTYNDKKKINYNKGSIGIAVLGDYRKDKPSDKSLDSLEKLIGWLAANNNITIEGERKFLGKKLGSGVIAHRDVDNTACPGKNIYSSLPSIRTASANLSKSYKTYAYKTATDEEVYEITNGKKYPGSSKSTIITLSATQLAAYPSTSSEGLSATETAAMPKATKWQKLLERNNVPEIYWQKYLPKISHKDYKKAVKKYQSVQKASS